MIKDGLSNELLNLRMAIQQCCIIERKHFVLPLSTHQSFKAIKTGSIAFQGCCRSFRFKCFPHCWTPYIHLLSSFRITSTFCFATTTQLRSQTQHMFCLTNFHYLPYLLGAKEPQSKKAIVRSSLKRPIRQHTCHLYLIPYTVLQMQMHVV